MRTMTVGEFKAQFSQVLKAVEQGEKIAITFGRKKEVKAVISPKNLSEKRELGILEGRSKVIFKDESGLTEEEFISL